MTLSCRHDRCRARAGRARRAAPRVTRAIALLATLCLALVVVMALGAGCGGDGAGGAPASPAPGPPTDPGLSPEPVPSAIVSTASGGSADGASGVRTVYLLGGSGARECIVGNAEWSAELSALAGFEVRAIDLGATNQSYTADRRYVCHMDDGPKVVVIGVGLGRYTSPPPPNVDCDKKLSPELQAALDGELDVEHRYSEKRIHSVERKKQLLATWLGERYPLFRKNYAANRDELAELLGVCRERGFTAVLLELPLNLEVAGDGLDAARATYAKDCRRLAGRYRARWVTFVDQLALPDTSFFDLAHLIEPGRTPWQTRLSEELVPLLTEQ